MFSISRLSLSKWTSGIAGRLLMPVLLSLLATQSMASSLTDDDFSARTTIRDRTLKLNASCHANLLESQCQASLLSEQKMILSQRCAQWLKTESEQCAVHATSLSGREYGRVLPEITAEHGWLHALLADQASLPATPVTGSDALSDTGELSFFSGEDEEARHLSIKKCSGNICQLQPQNSDQPLVEGMPLYQYGRLYCLATDSMRCQKVTATVPFNNCNDIFLPDNQSYVLCGQCRGQKDPDYGWLPKCDYACSSGFNNDNIRCLDSASTIAEYVVIVAFGAVGYVALAMLVVLNIAVIYKHCSKESNRRRYDAF